VSLVSLLDEKPPSWAVVQAAGVRTYYRLELGVSAGETVTALLAADVSGRVVDFEGLVWWRGLVHFDLSGSFPLAGSPPQCGLESAVRQRLLVYAATTAAFGKHPVSVPAP